MKEDKALGELETYIRSTYKKHYEISEGFSVLDIIFKMRWGQTWCQGNIMKYLFRMGKKDGETTKSDALKLCHYAILLLGELDDGE